MWVVSVFQLSVVIGVLVGCDLVVGMGMDLFGGVVLNYVKLLFVVGGVLFVGGIVLVDVGDVVCVCG